ncbi:MAG TPA: Hsp20/alpha crystallin family protein [Rhodothermales bacterium]|nr:Hsp20/alpha crystallin family protein [Rhodothermales bacterium]
MTKLVRYSPFGVRSPLFTDWNRFFDEFLPVNTESDTPTAWTPRVDLSETESEFRILLDLPGMKKDDVTINFESDMLTITGERREENSREDVNYYRTERFFGRFSRSFTFPKAVEIDSISAVFEDGVLTVKVPKAAESKPRKITIS